MKPVLTENGNIKAGKDGKPIYVGDDGKEFEFDVAGAAGRITELNAESAANRKDANKYKKDADTLTATNADLQSTVDSIGDDNKVEMEKFKTDTTGAWQKKVDELESSNTTLREDIFDHKVVSQIRNSNLIKTTVLPPAIFVNTFKGQFQQDHSAKGWDGRTILSKENPSNNASTDEALQVLLDTHPDRDSLLKASGAHGGEHRNGDGDNYNPKLSSAEKIKAGLAQR